MVKEGKCVYTYTYFRIKKKNDPLARAFVPVWLGLLEGHPMDHKVTG